MEKLIRAIILVVALFNFGDYLVTADIASCQADSTSAYACSVNDFGAKLITKLTQNDDGNALISPLSIYLALAMTYVGARGNTARQMKNALQLTTYGITRTELCETTEDVLDRYLQVNGQYDLKISNGQFVQKKFRIKRSYLDEVRTCYKAKIENVDFAGNGVTVMNDINKWVSDNTNKLIDKLLDEPLDPSTVLAILNAIYFKGTWKTRFEKENTTDGTFYGQQGNKIVPLMQLNNVEFPYFNDWMMDYQILEMPYKGENIVMWLALPNDISTIPHLQMDSSRYFKIKNSLRKRELNKVIVPRFDMTILKNLNSALSLLGIKDLFNPNSANLQGISTAARDLFVDQVLHDAVIKVNEEGTEAAAVTVVVVRTLAATLPLVFNANHPFSFYIIDKDMDLILFSGRFCNPT